MRRMLKSMMLGGALLSAAVAHASCPALPNVIANGQMADATKLMQDLNQLQDCINNGSVVLGPQTSVPISSPAGGTTSIKSPSASISYDLNLPVDAGQAGQILSSAGPGQAMAWISVPGLSKPPLVDGVPIAHPVASSFTWMNQGGATIVDHVNGPMTLVIPAIGTGFQFRGLYQAPPTAPYTLTVKLDDAAWLANYFSYGIFATDTAGKMLALQFYSSGNSSTYLNVSHIDSVTNSPSNVQSYQLSMRTAWLRIANDGTKWSMFISQNGADWSPLYSETLTSYLGATIKGVGILGLSYNGATVNNDISVWSYELKTGAGTDSSW